MTALEKISSYVENNPESRDSEVLTNFVRGLHAGTEFRLADLYDLTYDRFGLAIDLLGQWRLQRYLGRQDFPDPQHLIGA